MARWRLTAKHYLNVPGTEWEYKETNRETGKQARKVFSVPVFLDPDDPSDHNYPGEIIVSSKANGKDIVFVGPPSPEMEPLDDEAQAITDSLKAKWIHPIESLPGQYSQSLLDDLTRQLAAAIAGQPNKPAAAAPIVGVDPAEFAKLQEQVGALMAQNAELKAQAAESPARRT